MIEAINEEFSEIRLANAFKLPSQLTDADLIEMEKRVKAERPKWLRWQSRLHSGGYSSRECKKKRPKMPKSQLSGAERAALAAGWAEFDKNRPATQ